MMDFNMLDFGIYRINIIKTMMEYQQIIAKICYITGKKETEILKRIAEINTGEPNIDTANYLYDMSLMGIE